MALTILLKPGCPDVNVIEWFLDTTGAVELARGPLEVFDACMFRKTGLRFIREHFKAYKIVRLPHGREHTPVFGSRGDQRQLGGSLAIRIAENPRGVMSLVPYKFKSYSAGGMIPFPAECERRVPMRAGTTTFWKAFDEVRGTLLSNR
jgi:hypothetical protein